MASQPLKITPVEADFSDFSNGLMENIKNTTDFKGVMAVSNASFDLNLGGITTSRAWGSAAFSRLPAGYSVLKYFKTSKGNEIFVATTGGVPKLLYGNGSTNVAEFAALTPTVSNKVSTTLTIATPFFDETSYSVSTVNGTQYPYSGALGSGLKAYLTSISYQHLISDFIQDVWHNYFVVTFISENNPTELTNILQATYLESTDGRYKSVVILAEVLNVSNSYVVNLLCEGTIRAFTGVTGTGPWTSTGMRTFNLYGASNTNPNHFKQQNLASDTSVQNVMVGESSSGIRLYCLNTATSINSTMTALPYSNKGIFTFDDKEILPLHAYDVYKKFIDSTKLSVNDQIYYTVDGTAATGSPIPAINNIQPTNTPLQVNGTLPLDLDYQNTGGMVYIGARSIVGSPLTNALTGNSVYAAALLVTFVTDDGQEFLPYNMTTDLSTGTFYNWTPFGYYNLDNGSGNAVGTYATANFKLQIDRALMNPRVKFMRVYVNLTTPNFSTLTEPAIGNTGIVPYISPPVFTYNSQPTDPNAYFLYDEIDLTSRTAILNVNKHTFKPYDYAQGGICRVPKFYTFDYTFFLYNANEGMPATPPKDVSNLQTVTGPSATVGGGSIFGIELWGGKTVTPSAKVNFPYDVSLLTPNVNVSGSPSLAGNLGYQIVLQNIDSDTAFTMSGVPDNVTVIWTAPTDLVPSGFVTNKYQQQDVFTSFAFSPGRCFAVRKSNLYLTFSAIGIAQFIDFFPQEAVVQILSERYNPIGLLLSNDGTTLLVWDNNQIYGLDVATFSPVGKVSVGGLGRFSIAITPQGIMVAGTDLLITDLKSSTSLREYVRTSYLALGTAAVFYNPNQNSTYIFQSTLATSPLTVIRYSHTRKTFSKFTIPHGTAQIVELFVDPVTGIANGYDTSNQLVTMSQTQYTTSTTTFTTPILDYNQPANNKILSMLELEIDATDGTWSVTPYLDGIAQTTISGIGQVRKNFRMPRLRHKTIQLIFSGAIGTLTSPVVFKRAIFKSLLGKDTINL